MKTAQKLKSWVGYADKEVMTERITNFISKDERSRVKETTVDYVK